MLFLLSPAKSLNYEPSNRSLATTERLLADETRILSKTTKNFSRAKLREMMGISADLADLNFERFQAFKSEGAPEAEKHAVLAFNGDVYIGLDANSLEDEDLEWAQDHLRILSGFYGVLRPLDAMQPYRLEMGVKVHTRRGEDLYDFWSNKISKTLNEDLGEDGVVINLASKEYFKAVDKKALKARVITCDFKDIKEGKARTLAFFAKRARGLMARFAVENRIDTPEGLKAFNIDGYTFDATLSKGDTWVFSRPQPPAKK